MIGRTLLHYRVRERLGAGGMGEVYRATDTKLGREVAIKILPAEVAHDPVRLARFRREAQLLSALNHPNVGAIHGLEEVDGVPFLALELVEGEDLAHRLRRGAVPVDEALDIALQTAEAMEEAHRRGIVHRDLKPSNIKVTPDGLVKVLDFGLAKAWGGDGDSAVVAESPTLTHTGTMAGVILGTAAYMSPEQARGKAVDRRADVWSYGVVLWEMLTGRRLFNGDSVTDVLASVVTKEPDLDALPPETPPSVRRLIERCLRKDVRLRLPDIGSARLELQDLRAGRAPGAEAPRSVGGERFRRERLLWAAATIVATALAGAVVYRHLTAPRPEPAAAQFSVDPPDGQAFAQPWAPPSPDGRTLLLSLSSVPRTSAPVMWTHALASAAVQPLPPTAGEDTFACWSPDSRQIAFVAQNEVRALSVADGAVRKLCALPAPWVGGCDWGAGGQVLFSTGGDKGQIYAVDALGGEARLVLAADASRGEQLCHGPQFLPDGRRFLAWIASQREDVRGTYIVPFDAPGRRRRIAAAVARFSAGHLLFVRERSLLAQAFDVGRGETTGEPAVVLDSVGARPLPDGGSLGWFMVSVRGTLTWSPVQDDTGRTQIAWVDRAGRRLSTVGEPDSYGQFALAPDGSQVAVEIRGGERALRDLWVMDVARGVASRVTATPDVDEADPVWSPDGRITFAGAFTDGSAIRLKAPRTSAPEVALGRDLRLAYPESWSRDGKTLLFVRGPGDSNGVWALRLPGGELETVVAGFDADEPQISPDGRWLAYSSRESGRDEIYFEPFGGRGDRIRVSASGGAEPKWRQDGRELYYVSPGRDLMAVDVRAAGGRLKLGQATALFPLASVIGPWADNYAPAADGQRFLVRQPVGAEGQQPLRVVTYWPALLK